MYYPGDQRCERLMKILSKRQLSICFLLSYVVFVFWLTVGSRSVRIQQPCFELFKSFNDWFAGDKEIGKEIVGNILLFVPFGFFTAGNRQCHLASCSIYVP